MDGIVRRPRFSSRNRVFFSRIEGRFLALTHSISYRNLMCAGIARQNPQAYASGKIAPL
jgi:hypothetical protein